MPDSKARHCSDLRQAPVGRAGACRRHSLSLSDLDDLPPGAAPSVQTEEEGEGGAGERSQRLFLPVFPPPSQDPSSSTPTKPALKSCTPT